jgi:hypothetical protein
MSKGSPPPSTLKPASQIGGSSAAPSWLSSLTRRQVVLSLASALAAVALVEGKLKDLIVFFDF